MLYAMKYIATVCAYVEGSIFLNPTPVRDQEFEISRSELGEGSAFPPGYVPCCVVDLGRTIIQHYIYFLTVGSIDDCVSMNCLECSFPIGCDNNRLYSVSKSSE